MMQQQEQTTNRRKVLPKIIVQSSLLFEVQGGISNSSSTGIVIHSDSAGASSGNKNNEQNSIYCCESEANIVIPEKNEKIRKARKWQSLLVMKAKIFFVLVCVIAMLFHQSALTTTTPFREIATEATLKSIAGHYATKPQTVHFEYLSNHMRSLQVVHLDPNIVQEESGIERNDEEDYYTIPITALDHRLDKKRHRPTIADVHKKKALDPKKNASSQEKSKTTDNHQHCQPQHDWQTRSFPTCNMFHEQDLSLVHSWNERLNTQHQTIEYVASGAFRDVWKITNDFVESYHNRKESIALKTLVYHRDFELDMNDRHRRDAVANDRLAFSPYIAKIYGACGNSGLFEFAHGGSLEDIIYKRNFEPEEKLRLGYQTAAAVSAVHNTDQGSPFAAISHTDIKPKQYIYVPEEGRVKLTDFNRARFISWEPELNRTCPFTIGVNKGKYRSPEEYKYEPETEKIDVFMLGNVLYSILTSKKPFDDVSKSKVKKLVMKGQHPDIDSKFINSQDPSEQALLKAIRMCFEYDPHTRASSKTIETYLYSELKKQGFKKTIDFL